MSDLQIGYFLDKISFILPLFAFLIVIGWLLVWDHRIRSLRYKNWHVLNSLSRTLRRFLNIHDKISKKK
jgi:hypothetical protein